MKESSLSGRYALLCMFVLLGLSLHGNALAGPITFDTALPVASREGILRGQYILVRATDDPTPLGRSITVQAAPVALAYGVTPRLALFGVVPYFDKSLKMNTPSGRIERSASGVGDLLFLCVFPVPGLAPPAWGRSACVCFRRGREQPLSTGTGSGRRGSGSRFRGDPVDRRHRAPVRDGALRHRGNLPGSRRPTVERERRGDRLFAQCRGPLEIPVLVLIKKREVAEK